MDKKRVRRNIYWGLFILFVAGSIAAGSPFQLIDIIIVRPIVNFLFVIFNLVHDFGLAIILLTVIVKLCMLPLAIKQMNQMKLIRKIQPMLTEIKKNCNGNKQLESMQTMDLYRRYNVKPFSSILTLVIQLPIFIALFSAINVIANPQPHDNLMNRAYEIVAYPGSEIADLETKQQEYLSKVEEATKNGGQNSGISGQENNNSGEEDTGDGGNTENTQDGGNSDGEGNNGDGKSNGDENKSVGEIEYEFHPQLFGVINLNVKASDLLMGKFSWSAVFILVCAILASVVQYLVTKQQMPSGKSEKSKKFRDLVREAKEGRELDETDISNMTTRQMSTMMPIMMFILMFNFNGALVFYYFLTNLITSLQQWVILRKVNEEIDAVTDKAVLKELKNIQEAEVIENKKTGTTIRRINAKDIKEAETNKAGGARTAKNGRGGKGRATVTKKGGEASKKKRS